MAVSIIICSKDQVQLNRVSLNISKTIGCDHEIIHKINIEFPEALTKVYNQLSLNAKYENLIYLHDDLELNSFNWGQIIVEVLKNDYIGLVGLSGATYKSKFPGVWAASLKDTYRISNIDCPPSSSDAIYYNSVAVVDGCFMATKKSLLSKYYFDENLNGFHGYDIDFSLQIKQKYDVVVAKGIDFTHYSKGEQNIDWVKSTLYVHDKWKKQLPIAIKFTDDKFKKINDYLSAQNLYNTVFTLRYSRKIIIHYYFLFIFKYFRYNKLRYTKKTLKYFFLN